MNLPSNQKQTLPHPSPPLGFIGLGLLGEALAERALAAGLAVVGFDIDPERCLMLQRAGGRALGSAREVAQSCQRILLALPHDGVTSEVLQELAPVLARNTLILDATTGNPEVSVAHADALTRRGVTYLDTTVSGSSAQARAGEALLMVGGPQAAFDQCQELFHVLAVRTIHTGPSGTGAQMKLVTNLVLGLNRAALAEGLAFASAFGYDVKQTLEILRTSMAYSRIMDTKGEKMIQSDFQPQAKLSQHLKDVRLMLEAAADAGMQLPLTETHRRLLEQAEAAGLGDLDNSAIIEVIRKPQSPAQS